MSSALSRRAVVVGGAAAVAVALAVTLTVVLTRGPSRVPLRTPAYTADTVPALRTPPVNDLPKGCGVSRRTIDTYAPGDHAAGRTRCSWYSLNGGKEHCGWCVAKGGDRERVLDVTVEAPGPSASGGPSVAGTALRTLNPASVTDITGRTPSRTVTGLGDEARYTYTPAVAVGSAASGATVRFRVGTATVTVTYRGRDFSDDGPQRQVPEARARPAVLAAAADVARALHAPARPVLAEPAPGGPAPVRHVPRPCDLVPAALAERLAPGAERRRGQSPQISGDATAPVYGLTTDVCQWDSTPTCCLGEDTDHRPERHLAVTVRAFAEWRRGVAVPLATRDYLELHHDAREATGATGFRAVRGLGDQAFAVYDPAGGDTEGAGVTFRVRNLVIVVTYTGADGETVPHGPAVRAAYTVATHARTALPA